MRRSARSAIWLIGVVLWLSVLNCVSSVDAGVPPRFSSNPPGGWTEAVPVAPFELPPPGWAGAPRGWTPGGYEARIGSPYYYHPYDASPAGIHGGYPTHSSRHAPAAVIEGSVPDPGIIPPAHIPPANDVYSIHFGPGFYRHSEYGHVRFPYYSYRRPWYFPGHPVYSRDTNFPW